MASYTTNLNLKKPAGSENVAIGDINNNMDTIDTAYGTLNSNVSKMLYTNIPAGNTLIKVVKNFSVTFNSSGVWDAWNYNVGYNNYLLLQAYSTDWNDSTIIGMKDGHWAISCPSLAGQTKDFTLVLVYAPLAW